MVRRSFFVLYSSLLLIVSVGFIQQVHAYRCAMPGPFDWAQELRNERAVVALFAAERSGFKLVESLGVKGMQVGQNYQFTYKGCAAGRDSGFARRISKPYFVIHFFPPHNAHEVPPPRADPSGLKATRGTIHVATNFTTRTIALTSSACCPKEMISEFSTLDEAKSVLAALESKSEALQTTRVPAEPDAAPIASAVSDAPQTEPSGRDEDPWWQEPFLPVFLVWLTVLLVLVFRNK